MQGRTLVKNRKYLGCFVALESFNSDRVVAHGRDPFKVQQQADRKGVRRPVIVFVPPKGTLNLY
jgi:hypothetical protein